MKVKLLGKSSKKDLEKRVRCVAAAGSLSRFPGKVSEVYAGCNDYEKNLRFIERVIEMGHDSITDHDYLVFALEDVSVLVEQIIIAERICSFTIKSRREVNFSDSGYYVPKFGSKRLEKRYREHMNYLFEVYQSFLDKGVKKEDARFVLPYSFHSNIIMGIDAHVLKKMILKFTKGKEKKISELREFGEALYKIMEKEVPYLKKVIDNEESFDEEMDSVLGELGLVKEGRVLDKVKLISWTENIDDTIFISSLMKNYGYGFDKAKSIYDDKIKDNSDLKEKMLGNIYNSCERLEFKQVNFRFQVPISLAVLTHLTRHRTHSLMIPEFWPVNDLEQYIFPEAIKQIDSELYEEVYRKNKEVYDYFKREEVREEDLIYFHLAGNMINVVTNMDGATLAHIASLRVCTKAQWEIRNIVSSMVKLVQEKSEYYGKVLAPSCVVYGKCKEGKESCGKINFIKEEQIIFKK